MKELGRECRLSTLGPIEMPISALRPFHEYNLPRLDKRLTQSKTEGIDYYVLFVHEDRDMAFLSMLKSFLESAPQLMLQTYIWTKSSGSTQVPEIVRGAAIITSLVQISWSLCSYQRAVRRMTAGKRNMTSTGTILQFMWRLLTIGSRVGAIILFTSRYGYWVIPVAVGHWGLMTVWIMHQGTNFCDDPQTGECRPCQEYMFDMIIGAIYLICFIPVRDEPTRYKYTAFYAITFSENTLLTLSWYFALHDMVWYQTPALVWVFGSFGLGIFFMLLYYRYFHPNGKPVRVNRAASCC